MCMSTPNIDRIERMANIVCMLVLVITALYFGWYLAVYFLKKFVVQGEGVNENMG